MARVAVILSGCGVQDGSEIHESVLCLLALDQMHHTYEIFAPDKAQTRVINHLTGKPAGETRNCLIESARIARGKIKSLTSLDADQFEAILLPGGFGAALNLSDFGIKNKDCHVDPELAKLLTMFFNQKKKILATCISPVLIARILGNKIKLTLGTDPEQKKILDQMGASGQICSVNECIADTVNRIYTTPCYMEPPALAEMFLGIQKMVGYL